MLSGMLCDTHGDLHLDHIYAFPGAGPPEDLVVIDCIEFNERFRFADPIADMAFVVMDLGYHGRRDIALEFTNAYLDAAGDSEGIALVPFFSAYRAAVRTKVEGIKALESEVVVSDRKEAADRATALWMLALDELERPGKRPCLVLIGGLPGTGKSTLAHGLAQRAGFDVLRSDVIRKELAQGENSNLYTPAWHTRIYAECLHRAKSELMEGRRVIVDATFREESQRLAFLELAKQLALRSILVICELDRVEAERRLEARRNDVSDANTSIYREMMKEWEPLSKASASRAVQVSTSGEQPRALDQVLLELRTRGMAE